ncbi:thermonuclease family protein [Gymnodinialimonas ulvae]|uniref:thermonuclease family protein n=1 Tax=Gymnodinialimonas ulvae TaxID=3126504 RepID=UPI0030A4D9A6
MRFSLALMSALFGHPPLSAQAEEFEGPFFGEVLRVIDGDTFDARVNIWPDVTTEVSIRIRGIDAPEMHRSEDCEEEAYYGSLARLELEDMLPNGTEVRLEYIEPGSFSGRFIADVLRRNTERGSRIDTMMMRTDYVVPWSPGDDAVDWCAHFQALGVQPE